MESETLMDETYDEPMGSDGSVWLGREIHKEEPCSTSESTIVSLNSSLDLDVLWRSLPEELLDQVLQRLPFRSVLKFRSVCKKWNEIFTSTSFFVSYRHKPEKLVPLYMDTFMGTIVIYDTKRSSWLQDDVHARLPELPSRSFLVLVASNGGLLCFAVKGSLNEEPPMYVIYNLLTKRSEIVKMDQTYEVGEILVKESKYNLFAIDVDFSTGFYNLVVAMPFKSEHVPGVTFIYNSGSRLWRVGCRLSVKNSDGVDILLQCTEFGDVQGSEGHMSQSVVSKGKCYWMVHHRHRGDVCNWVVIYETKLDRWSYVKCSIADDKMLFLRVLENNNEVLIVGKRAPQLKLNRFRYFEILQAGPSETMNSSRVIRDLYLQEKVMPMDLVINMMDAPERGRSNRHHARPSWCIGLGGEMFFFLEALGHDGGHAIRFTSPMVHYSSVDNSWTWLADWKMVDDENGGLKPEVSKAFWAYQPTLINP